MLVPVVRPARPDEADVVHDVLAEAAAWLRSRGIEQWPARFPAWLVARDVARGEAHLALAGDVVVGTLTLQWRDALAWADPLGKAGYVHRLAVRRSHAGQGLGGRLLDWAGEQVASAGKRLLRLDCMADNAGLRRYYEGIGFTHLGDVDAEFPDLDAPGETRLYRTSLFQRAVQADGAKPAAGPMTWL